MILPFRVVFSRTFWGSAIIDEETITGPILSKYKNVTTCVMSGAIA
jgi:hypothetical protein